MGSVAQAIVGLGKYTDAVDLLLEVMRSIEAEFCKGFSPSAEGKFGVVFKKLFGRKNEPKTASPLLFVCIRDLGPIQWDAMRTNLTGEQVQMSAAEGNVVSFDFPQCTIQTIFISAAVPDSEADAQIPFSRFWNPDDSATHQSHLVMFSSTGELLEQLRCLAKLAQAVSKSNDVVCLYCGNANQIINPETASDLCDDDAWLSIWVNVITSQNQSGGIDASTIGLESLGHHEFELVGTQQSIEDTFGLLLDLSSYVLNQGPVMKHGQTFGRTAEEKYRIEVGRSRLGKPGTVIRLNW